MEQCFSAVFTHQTRLGTRVSDTMPGGQGVRPLGEPRHGGLPAQAGLRCRRGRQALRLHGPGPRRRPPRGRVVRAAGDLRAWTGPTSTSWALSPELTRCEPSARRPGFVLGPILPTLAHAGIAITFVDFRAWRGPYLGDAWRWRAPGSSCPHCKVVLAGH